MRLLGVEREDLERDLGVRNEQGDNRLRAELAQRLQAMIAVRRPVPVALTDRHDRIEKAAQRFDDLHEPLDVRLRRVTLVRRRLDTIDRERREEDGGAAERLAVRGEHGAAVLVHLRREPGGRRIVERFGIGGRQADGLGGDLLPATNGPFLRHASA